MRFAKYIAVVAFVLAFPALCSAAEVSVMNPAGIRPDGNYVDEFVKKGMQELKASWPPKVNDFPKASVEKLVVKTDAEAEVNRLFFLRGWTDGLPIVAPTPERVKNMLRGTDVSGDDVVGVLKPLDGQATVEKIAVNAVMAGCRPEHLPYLIAAVSALADPDFDQLGPATTTGYETHMLLVSGPEATRIDLNPGSGTLGRGIHGNAALGRALHLVVQNIGGSAPGITDMSTHGNTGEFGMAVVENQKQNPWGSLQGDLGHPARANVATVTAVGSTVQIVSIGMKPEQILDAVAQSFTTTKKMSRSKLGIWLLPPDVAAELSKAGFDKAKIDAAVKGRMGAAAEGWNLHVVVSGGPGEKNLLLSGFYSIGSLVSREVELPSTWDELVKESKAGL